MVALCESDEDCRRDDLVTKQIRVRKFVSRQAIGEDAVRGVVLATCMLLVAMNAAAEAESTKPVQRFVCVFDEHVSAETTGLSRTSPLRFEFIVDETGYAFAVAQIAYPVKWLLGDSGMTFFEVLTTGAVQTTTINDQGEAVHSRHTILLGELVASQYYGTCK